MKTLSSPMQTATAALVTRPGHLVEISFASVARLSSIGDVTWDGYPWSAGRQVQAAGVSMRGGRLVIGNTDDAYTALVQVEGVAGRRIRVWAADASALASGDPELIFDGVGDASEIGPDVVTINLVIEAAETAESPRRYADQSAGFNHLTPAETGITVGSTRFTLTREER